MSTAEAARAASSIRSRSGCGMAAGVGGAGRPVYRHFRDDCVDARMTLEHATALDRADPLAAHREKFALPEGIIYLDGTSLGAQPRAVVARMASVVSEEWGRDLITSWNVHAWIALPR